MSTAILELKNFSELTPRDIATLNRDIDKAKKAKLKQQEYAVSAQKIGEFAEQIEKRWDELPKESQQALKDLAYSIVHSPNHGGLIGLIENIQAAFVFYQAYRQGFGREFLAVILAIDSLIDGILSAIENESLLECFSDLKAVCQSPVFVKS
ncbi:hypothetical protein [Spirulina major]|uniref:hypothetical protein n=1 Tax=Spirulina major TaxID=270636 RepID=UPI0009335B35|nr:hypothetical protein [Spirulina major]